MAAPGGFNISMIRGQIDTEPVRQKQVEEVRHERLTSPLSDLVMHACSAKRHAVHYLIHCIDNQTDDARLGSGDYLLYAIQSTAAQSLGVCSLLWRQALLYPELCPQRGLLNSWYGCCSENRRAAFPQRSPDETRM